MEISLRACGASLTMACTLWCAGAAHAQATAPQPQLPAKPSTADLEAKQPGCKYDVSRLDLPKIDQCRQAWENYRLIHLEGYNTACSEFAKELKRLDAKLQRQVARKEMRAEDYEDFKEALSDALVSATVRDGALLKRYFDFFAVYSQAVKGVQADFNKARFMGT